MPVSGSANLNEPPMPGGPNAFSEEPNTNFGKGFVKPSKIAVSTRNTLSRKPSVGGIGGLVRASRVGVAMPSSEPPVATEPYSLATDRAVPMPFMAGSSTVRSSSRLKSRSPRAPGIVTARG